MRKTGDTGGAWGTWTPTFLRSKKKKQKLRKKRVSKQQLLKGCCQGQNVTVLAIPEHLEFKKCSCCLTFRCSMAVPL